MGPERPRTIDPGRGMAQPSPVPTGQGGPLSCLQCVETASMAYGIDHCEGVVAHVVNTRKVSRSGHWGNRSISATGNAAYPSLAPIT